MKLLKFYADWCAPCKVLSTQLHGFDAIPVEEVNIEDLANADLVNKHAVRGLPTLIIVDDAGEALFKRMGSISKAELEKTVRSLK